MTRPKAALPFCECGNPSVQFRARCEDCQRARRRQRARHHYARNREAIIARKTAWLAAQPEEKKAAIRERKNRQRRENPRAWQLLKRKYRLEREADPKKKAAHLAECARIRERHKERWSAARKARRRAHRATLVPSTCEKCTQPVVDTGRGPIPKLCPAHQASWQRDRRAALRNQTQPRQHASV